MDIKISQLPEPKHISLSDLLPVVNDGHTKAVTLEHLIYELEYLLEHMPHSTRLIAKDAKCQSNRNSVDILELKALIEQLKGGGADIDLSKALRNYYNKTEINNLINTKIGDIDLSSILKDIATLKSYHHSESDSWLHGSGSHDFTSTDNPGDQHPSNGVKHITKDGNTTTEKAVSDSGITVEKKVVYYDADSTSKPVAGTWNTDKTVLTVANDTTFDKQGSVEYIFKSNGLSNVSEKYYWYKPLYWWFGTTSTYDEGSNASHGISKTAKKASDIFDGKNSLKGDTVEGVGFGDNQKYLFFMLPDNWKITKIHYEGLGATDDYNVIPAATSTDPRYPGYTVYKADKLFAGVSNSTITVTGFNGSL